MCVCRMFITGTPTCYTHRSVMPLLQVAYTLWIRCTQDIWQFYCWHINISVVVSHVHTYTHTSLYFHVYRQSVCFCYVSRTASRQSSQTKPDQIKSILSCLSDILKCRRALVSYKGMASFVASPNSLACLRKLVLKLNTEVSKVHNDLNAMKLNQKDCKCESVQNVKNSKAACSHATLPCQCSFSILVMKLVWWKVKVRLTKCPNFQVRTLWTIRYLGKWVRCTVKGNYCFPGAGIKQENEEFNGLVDNISATQGKWHR